MKGLAIQLILLLLTVKGNTQEVHHRSMLLMGSRFDITVVAQNSVEADLYIDLAVNEISRIEKLISSWDPESQTSLVNSKAGVQPVKVDKELYDLILRCISISKLTEGAFDISYASMDRLWKFDGRTTEMPAKELVEVSVKKVGYQHIILDSLNQTVFLDQTSMKIGFGAIGKGYAADKAKKLLINQGVQAGIINASGDMNTWGRQPDGSDWRVAITNPFYKNNAFATFPISGSAVVTSGNYEKYVIIDGKRYAHIIDPRTGYPTSGILSVTVFASSAELADALATAVFVLGKDTGVHRIDQLPGIECIVIDDKGRIYTSRNIDINKI